VIVDELESRSLEGEEERSARLRWDGGELRVRIVTPSSLAGPAEDATPFLALSLLQAMRRHEDLQVEGEVSARFLARVEQLQTLYHAWDLGLRRCGVSVAGTRSEVSASAGSEGPTDARGGAAAPAHSGTTHDARRLASFFSRGIDSTYSAAIGRTWPGPLELLVFVDGIEPKHDAAQRAEDVVRAHEAADAIGLPLAVCRTNVRESTDLLMSWSDAHGSALAAVGQSLAGGVRHLVVPSTQTPAGVGPMGSSPMTDPLHSTEAVEVEHDALLGRSHKTVWIARERPDLLPHLKVCFATAGSGNCGRCGKCLHTMASLEAAGALAQAPSFPDTIDIGLVTRMRQRSLEALIDWMELWRLLPDGPLRSAIGHSLRRSAVPGPRDVVRALCRRRSPFDRYSHSSEGFVRHRFNTAMSLIVKGRPYP
jgi:hypothetical protein